jgi:hypothetical protein
LLSSIAVGALQGMLGHALLLGLGLICHVAVLSILLFSGDKLVDPETPIGAVWIIELLCAFLWGTGDATLNTQLAKWLGRADRVVDKSAPIAVQREELQVRLLIYSLCNLLFFCLPIILFLFSVYSSICFFTRLHNVMLQALSSNLRMWQCFCAAFAFFLDPLIPGVEAVTIINAVLLLVASVLFIAAIVRRRVVARCRRPACCDRAALARRAPEAGLLALTAVLPVVPTTHPRTHSRAHYCPLRC